MFQRHTKNNFYKIDLVNKEERRFLYKSMTSKERPDLILNKMKSTGIKAGSEVPDKKYNTEEIYELTYITKYFRELREQIKN